MLVCVFIFEMEGLDEGSWIKVLNLSHGLIVFYRAAAAAAYTYKTRLLCALQLLVGVRLAP